MTWILTRSGRKFDLANPTADMVDPADIAHSLSMQCRFNGHTSSFYSVAQHCYLVADLVPAEDQLAALLHDATEAYVGDMVRPLKEEMRECARHSRHPLPKPAAAPAGHHPPREGYSMSTFHDPMTANISLHGLGFIQVQLQGNQRLHVWHPELPRRKCFENSAIHNHRFNFTSRVLIGQQINIKVRPVNAVEGAATHLLYLHEGARTANGGRPWTPNAPVAMDEYTSETIEAGQEYFMPAYHFHRTEPGGDGKVATIMTKLAEGKRGAMSSCRIGIEPDTDFDRFQLSPALLWSYVLEVLGGPNQVVGALETTAMTADTFLTLTGEISKTRRAAATLTEKATELCDALENKDDLPLHKYALRAGRLVSEVRHLATDLARQQSGSPAGLDIQQQEAGQ